ncbi:MAG: hypothetical protein DRJ60_07340 [Thermoprotei archaeon]|nr:MAG: hypothetical protein DRJ60_07340 [Thermoprotei archaeon]
MKKAYPMMALKKTSVIAIIIVIVIIVGLAAWFTLGGFGAAPVRLKWAECATGSVAWIGGSVFAKTCMKHGVGLEITVIGSTCSVENMHLLREGKADVVHDIFSFARDCYYGQGKFVNASNPNLRAIVWKQSNVLGIVTLAETGINKLTDLAGKKVVVGAPGTAVYIQNMRVLEALGLADKIIPEEIDWTQGCEALRDRRVDAVMSFTYVPNTPSQQLFATPGINAKLIGLNETEIQILTSLYPYYVEYVIPPNTYPGQDYEVHTIAQPVGYFCNADLPEDVVYKIVKAIYEYYPEMAEESVIWAHFNPELGPKLPEIPYHPGAIKFYKEVGLWPES